MAFRHLLKKIKKETTAKGLFTDRIYEKNDHEKNICVLIHRKPNNKLI